VLNAGNEHIEYQTLHLLQCIVLTVALWERGRRGVNGLLPDGCQLVASLLSQFSNHCLILSAAAYMYCGSDDVAYMAMSLPDPFRLSLYADIN